MVLYRKSCIRSIARTAYECIWDYVYVDGATRLIYLLTAYKLTVLDFSDCFLQIYEVLVHERFKCGYLLHLYFERRVK